MSLFESNLKRQGMRHRPRYHSANKLLHIQNILKSQDPLVSIKEINDLRELVAKAASGEYFLIQSGDCTGGVYECDQDTSYAKLEFIQQIAEFFQRKTQRSVIQVARTAGQYAKPGNNAYESSQSEKMYSYWGETLNQRHKKHRIPEPWRMLLSYNCSASVHQEMNLWNRKLDPEQKIYNSQEALSLYYDQAFTRWDKQSGLYYHGATHFLWLGKHRISSSPHSNYLKKIANPVALKIGPDTSIKNLIATINELDPNYIPGRITLIPGLGAGSVHRILPQLIEAVQKTQRTVLWSCDPMHGNTEVIRSGVSIRKLSHIVEEIKSSFLIHRTMGSQLNAIHLEATDQDVSECVDYASSIADLTDCNKSYNASVAPRLNYEQTIHVIQCLAKHYIE